jgi:acylpyruvate hydrolase
LRFLTFYQSGVAGLAVLSDAGEAKGLLATEPDYPGGLAELIEAGPGALQSAADWLRRGEVLDLADVVIAPPLLFPGKILCVGLNYHGHVAESGMKLADYPTIFARFHSSLVGHDSPIVRSRLSEKLDFEGELVAIIGRGGRHISKERALDHVVGYSIFNDASVRDYQLKTTQWTVGKNFDATGSFGPYFVSADRLPPGATGLRLETRLNGELMQSASTSDLIFDVATLVSTISESMTLSPGDIIVTGTPSGIGHARNPPLYMKPGDICEVEVEGIGVLRNTIVDERNLMREAA